MRADLHTHTVFSDGELIPAELVRRAMVLGHDVIAITDHVDMTNVEFVASNVAKAVELCEDYIRVIPGVEITHVPPSKIDHVAKLARKYGADWIVVHGETVTEPVAPGTNRASVESPEVDVLAHPGFITLEEAQIARDNGVLLEVSGRAGHNITATWSTWPGPSAPTWSWTPTPTRPRTSWTTRPPGPWRSEPA